MGLPQKYNGAPHLSKAIERRAEAIPAYSIVWFKAVQREGGAAWDWVFRKHRGDSRSDRGNVWKEEETGNVEQVSGCYYHY